MQQLWLTCFKCSDMSLFIGNTAVFYELTIHKTAYLFRNMVAASLAYVQNLNQSACNGKQSPLAFVNARYMLTQRVWLVMRHEHELPCTCPVHSTGCSLARQPTLCGLGRINHMRLTSPVWPVLTQYAHVITLADWTTIDAIL